MVVPCLHPGAHTCNCDAACWWLRHGSSMYGLLTSPTRRSGAIHSREFSCPEFGRCEPSIARDRPTVHQHIVVCLSQHVALAKLGAEILTHMPCTWYLNKMQRQGTGPVWSALLSTSNALLAL